MSWTHEHEHQWPGGSTAIAQHLNTKTTTTRKKANQSETTRSNRWQSPKFVALEIPSFLFLANAHISSGMLYIKIKLVHIWSTCSLMVFNYFPLFFGISIKNCRKWKIFYAVANTAAKAVAADIFKWEKKTTFRAESRHKFKIIIWCTRPPLVADRISLILYLFISFSQ